MKASLRDKLDAAARRLEDIDALLGAEGTDAQRLRELGSERSELAPVVGLHADLLAAEAAREQARSLLADPEMRALAEEELLDCGRRIEQLEQALQGALLPRDPDDRKAAFLEVRAGTGGEESALFAADLLRMYTRYAERRGWRTELLGHSESDLGGVKEAVLRIAGDGVYGRLKFESGGHRVQRVPATESQGRIHTSAATVAVMPEPDAQATVAINPAELRIDTFRSSGAGGQHINKTDSAVRITHLPTGLVVECQDDRSQHRNKARAMEVLAARLEQRQRQQAQEREAAQRKSLVGSGDRSDRIRTYNVPQGRVTDHRINLTLHKIDAILGGELDELLDALHAEHQAEQLAALG
ncbi:MAG: peptide chain release factor 1 [Betaproteobacteria bacterium]|nr:peptide chain release factor 1 [Betaproteobacteria bacterium]MBU6511900.1 peptide chain release factor 1 [Betaproteobacteria bacterium]MDE1956544.1 peptide chain release factor 1 [Betaproteobacteria bacterium]MDE2152261.1 peptide chain release factor 1 [Betaproteobacteria bacterium]MDE2478103.1 peptide chain release factor 1 [Betaproteobacteria bacterium]